MKTPARRLRNSSVKASLADKNVITLMRETTPLAGETVTFVGKNKTLNGGDAALIGENLTFYSPCMNLTEERMTLPDENTSLIS